MKKNQNFLNNFLLCLSLLFPELSHGAILHDNPEEPFSNIPPGTAISLTEPVSLGAWGMCRTVFWPIKHIDANGGQVKWLGEVFALFQDENGATFEDTNRNGTLDLESDVRVEIFENAGELSGCYGEVSIDATCDGTVKPISHIAFLWSASSKLNSIPLAEITTNRSDINDQADRKYISTSPQRNIFTWNDLDNNGIVDQRTEILPFERDWGGRPSAISLGDQNHDSRNLNMVEDFGVATQEEMNALINWIRGQDQEGFRSRGVPEGMEGEFVTWRLGDIIHSTPVMVGRPSENYHLLYKDESYASFVAQYQNRRQVIYFGANDGMLHAVNNGFAQESSQKFCLTENCQNESSAPALGTELWAYIPYNLAPHLQCLADPDYKHEYYVDLKPKVFDVRIFADDKDHPKGWGTILVGGMRFGGVPVSAKNLDLEANGIIDGPTDQRVFSSAYFIFDITNPEKPPILLGEMTHKNGAPIDSRQEASIGSTTSSPAVVPVFNNTATNDSDWYLVFGNGPTELPNTSNQKPRLFIMPLHWLAGVGDRDHELRFPLFELTGHNAALQTDGGAAHELPTGKFGFLGDPVAVDFELLPDYKTNVVYFGTSEHQAFAPGQNDEFDGALTGKMYRLIIGDRNYIDGRAYQAQTTPLEWHINVFADVQQPISSPTTVGWDKENFWLFFGTGTIPSHGCEDHHDNQQSFYGIKEPMETNFQEVDSRFGETSSCEKIFTWDSIEKGFLSPGAGPGQSGLLNVTPISISWNGIFKTTTVHNSSLTGNDYQSLIDTIAGKKRGCEIETHGLDGWYRNFQEHNERSFGPANLLGGLLTFTTFSPQGRCFGEGKSNLYALYYQTGVAWQEPIFQNNIVQPNRTIEPAVELGRGHVSTPKIQVGRKKPPIRKTDLEVKKDTSKTGESIVVQTSPGAIIKIEQSILPTKNYKTGRQSWFEGIPITPQD